MRRGTPSAFSSPQRALCVLAWLALAAAAHSGLAPRLQAQEPGNVVELKPDEVTAERLVDILTPRGGSRGLSVAPRTPHCDLLRRRATHGTRVRGIAATAAIRVDFDFNSAQITPAAEATLAAMGQALGSERLASSCIMISGHTDAIGSDAFNDRLSRRRAEAVVGYLASHFGLDAQRLVAVGRGKREPIAGNDSAEGRQRNRRVEIGNLGAGDEP